MTKGFNSLRPKLAIISLGGNFPDTANYFEQSIKKIDQSLGVLKRKSSIYQTAPWGFKEKVPDFLNQVIGIETNLTPSELLNKLKVIEKEFGRIKTREDQYESRPLDLDILFYENEIITLDNLSIPHKFLHERNFILRPLADIYPDLTHPIFQKSIKELLLQSKDQTIVKLLKETPSMKYNFTVIEGNIGSGKTSLVKKLAKEFNTELILEEFEENPFLSSFLENQDKNNLAVELQFLIDRFHQLNFETSNQQVISDYFIEKSLIFSKTNLNEHEKTLFDTYFKVLFDKIKKPDLLVYLSVNTDRLIENIIKRGRSYEQNISRDYLEKIHQAYLRYFESLKNQKVLVIDTTKIDFVNDTSHYQELIKLINDNYTAGVTEVKL